MKSKDNIIKPKYSTAMLVESPDLVDNKVMKQNSRA